MKSKKIIELNENKAKEYFMEEKSYVNFDLPYYFSFSKILNESKTLLQEENISNQIKKSKKYEGVNYVFLSNKDGSFAWRPFQIIHPILYTDLVNLITKKNNWQKVEKNFFKILNNFNLNVRDKYFCHISLYGPEGQFKYPNTINLRIKSNKDIKNANETIAHELIHLLIYNKVKKLKLNYQQTEGVVDLFFTETKLKTIFPKYKLESVAIHNKEIFQKLI